MTGRLFWLVTAGVAAVAAHIASILFLPGLVFSHKLATVTNGQKPNSFFLMAPEQQAALLPSATAADIVGLCLIDLGKGKVVINATVPLSLWSFAVYNSSGQQVYGINDVEASANSFTVELSHAKGFIEQVRGKPEAEDAANISNVGWHAEVNGDKAVAVLWVPVQNPLERKALEETVRKSTCQAG